MNKRFSGVIFDLDGTLLDSLADLAQAMNVVLEELGFPTHEEEQYRYFVGDGIELLAWRVLPQESRDPQTVAVCVAGMRQEYGRRWREKSKPYPGIEELLLALAARRIKMAILSNKPHNFTQETVGYFFPEQPWALVSGARPGLPLKPDPAGALEIAAALALAPGDFLYLGDTATDMQTANSAGMHAIGALWGFRPAGELLAAGARLTLTHPLELLDCLE